MLKKYLSAKREEFFKVRMILLDYLHTDGSSADVDENNNISKPIDELLVSVTSIIDPGQFHVVHWSDIEKRDHLFASLQDVAPNCSLPDVIVPNQIYAVLSSEQKWFRATIALHHGISLVLNFIEIFKLYNLYTSLINLFRWWKAHLKLPISAFSWMSVSKNSFQRAI